ncbi:MAG: HlyD family efflux transporter periplasmic adaptor subunit [Bryobacterales bacterium]|nr:HlyD family efflux transporter periplasmic adaptor subunit [Bryobacterales bacterium]
MQQSSVPAPNPAPLQTEKKPVLVQAEPKKPRGTGWIWLAVIVAFCAGGYYLYQRNLASEIAAKRTAAATMRTSTVTAGKVASVIRLTGTTGPEKFSTILGPQLRGSRSFAGGGGAAQGRSRGGGGSSGGSSGGAVASSGGGSSSSGSSSGSSSSSSGTGGLSIASSSSAMSGGGSGSASGGSSASMMGGAGGSTGGVRSASNALRAATSRTSSSSSSRSTSSSSSSRSSSGSALGSEGLGSTSGSLFSGGGGGGGGGGGMSGGDFGAVLQTVIKPGTIIEKGATVAEFDRQYMLQRVDDYKAGVEQQESNMKRQLADLDVTRKSHEQSINTAKGDVDKAKLDLRTVPVRSDIESERFKLALEENDARHKQLLREVPFVRAGEESQVKIAEMDLKQSQIELRRAEQNADRMLVKAPIGGMVVMMSTFRGSEFAQIQAGDPIMPGMPFMQIVDPSSMVVNALMNQVDVERVRVGAKARVRFDAFPDLELPAHVFSVAAMPRSSFSSRASFLKEIPVRIKLDKMDPRVIPDLSVSVDVIIEEEDASAIAPASAIFRDAPDAKPYVYVKVGETWARREVELGLSNYIQTVIRSGLKAGEVVAEQPPLLGPDKSGGSTQSS